jgi:hypothetical protein
MIANVETWGVVLSGHWNSMIFSPPWVNENVFNREESELLVTFPQGLSTVYRHRQVILEIVPGRLVVRPREPNDRCLRRAEEMALAVLDVLVHTPMMAVGINFTFSESAPTDRLLNLFNSADGVGLTELGWVFAERRLLRQMRNDTRTLNLTLSHNGHEVGLDFNFHADARTIDEARNAVRNQILVLRDSAVAILRHVYNLEFVG